MEHNVLQLEISVDYENINHVAEAHYQLLNDLLYRVGMESPPLVLHQFFEITAIAVFHEDVVPGVCLDCLFHLHHVITDHCVLVLDLRHDQALLSVAKVSTLDYFACVQVFWLQVYKLVV